MVIWPDGEPMTAADLPLPRGSDPRSIFTWAQALLNALRRRDQSAADRVTTVEESVEATDTRVTTAESTLDDITDDRTASLAALAAYAVDVQAAITAAGGHAQDVYDDYAAAAAAQQAELASHYLTEAANRVETFVRIEEDGVLSSSISTVSASLATTNAAITTEATARANGDSANATAIATVQTQANGNSASITTIANSAGGTDVNYGLIATSNGQVKAAFNMSTGVQGSDITFISNRFAVALNGAPGTLITPFVAGLVNGIATVGINGNLNVDGSILARHIAAGEIDASHIDVATLDAISADVGEITAGVLRSSDGDFVIDLDNKTITITT